MRFVARCSALLLTLAFLFLLQEQRVLAIGGINPNLILVVFLSLVFSGEPITSLYLIALAFLGLVFLWTPFWFMPAAIAVCIGCAASIFNAFLTGNRLLDFVVGLVIATVLVYAILAFPRLGTLSVPRVLFEALYNVVLGVIARFLLMAVKNQRARL